MRRSVVTPVGIVHVLHIVMSARYNRSWFEDQPYAR